MSLPSWIDNPLSIAALRFSSALPSISPIKTDSSLVTKAISSVVGGNNAWLTFAKNLDAVNRATDLLPQSVTDRIANVKNLVANPSTVIADTGGLAFLANKLNVSFTPSPNELNQYVTYTYHIRFFMSPEFQSYNVNEESPTSDGLDKIIIAESGVTAGFNISELRMDSICSPDARVRASWTNMTFDLTILEPLGISLMDRILAGAKQLQIKDSTKSPYFIELWFNGYDENGVIVADKMFYQLYRVKINDMNLNTTAAGTTYNINLLSDGTYGEANASATPPAGTQVTATTLGEFFDKFQDWWNAMSANINYDKVARKTYKIEYPKDWSQWTLKNIDVAKQNARSTDFHAQVDGNATVITIARGQSIESIVNYVVYLCENAQKWITGEDAPGSGNASLKEHGLLRFVTVRAKTKITGWDTVTKSYTYEITYILFPTESTKAFTDMQTVEQIMQTSTQAQKLQYLAQNNRLRKRYDYIYTGLNTEVINFNFQINNAWKMVLPLYSQVNNYNQITIGGTVAPNSVGYQAVIGTLPTGQSAVPANVQNPPNVQQSDLALPPGTRTILDDASATPLTERQIASQAARQGDTLGSPIPKSPGQQAAQAAQDKGVQGGTPGVNPILSLSESGKGRAVAYIEDAKNLGITDTQPFMVSGSFDPAPSYQNVSQNADQNKIDVDPDPSSQRPGAGFIGAVIGNIFNNRGGAFGTIDLEIRGDPWWIPMSNIKQDQLASQLAGNKAAADSVNKINSAQVAQFLSGDNLFLLSFRPGIVIDENTGLARTDSQQQEYFTGLYAVQRVISVFRNGSFTQTLNANKDILAQSLPPPTTSDTSVVGNTNRDRSA